MVKIYTLLSDGQPIADIRTDGRKMEFLNDRSEGNLLRLAGNDWKKLMELVKRSSHLSLQAPQANLPGILRYRLSNGDVVEITTDGRTASINGDMINEPEKQALFHAIRMGELTIVSKPSEPVPMYPRLPDPFPKKKDEPKDDYASADQMRKASEDEYKKRRSGSATHDAEIEKQDFSELDEMDRESAKKLCYKLKHGGFPGEDNG